MNSDEFDARVPTSDEFALEIPKPEPGPLDRWPHRNDLAPGFVLWLTCLAFSYAYWMGSDIAANKSNVFGEGEWHRLLSSMLVHADIGHWLSNGPLLVFFGWFLRGFFGFWLFPSLCCLLGMVIHAATLYYMAPKVNLVGISGLVYAMVAMWLIFYMRFEKNRRFAERLMRCIGFSLIMMFPTTYNPSTSYLAHGMGFGFGLVFGLLLIPLAARQLGPQEQALDGPTLH